MIQKRRRKKADIYHYLLLIILITAVGISSGWDFRFGKKNVNISMNLNTISEIFPKANGWLEVNENIYKALSGTDTLGYGILVTNNPGYGGPVPLLIRLQEDTITKVHLLDNNETEEFLIYIKEDDLTAQWEGIHVKQVSDMNIAEVSGATETSNAIIRGVRQGAARFLNEEQSHLKRDFLSIAEDIVFLLVILLSLAISYVRSLKKYRWIYLLIVLLVFGIFTGKVLSLK
ncbi:MAG: FMN-binding protein, partial [Bacteroidota bacterium]